PARPLVRRRRGRLRGGRPHAAGTRAEGRGQGGAKAAAGNLGDRIRQSRRYLPTLGEARAAKSTRDATPSPSTASKECWCAKCSTAAAINMVGRCGAYGSTRRQKRISR